MQWLSEVLFRYLPSLFFTIGNNFILYSMNFINGIATVIMPMISKKEGRNGRSKLHLEYTLYSKNVSYITAPICTTFFIFGADFINLWMGDNYGIVSGNILNILTFSYFFFLLQRAVAYPILMGTSRIKFYTYLMVATAILNLAISILWGKKFGVYGVAWGTTVPNIIFSFGIIWYMCNNFKLSILKYLIEGIIIPSTPSLFFAASALTLNKFIIHQSYHMIFFNFSVSTIIYFLIVFFFYIDKEIRFLVLNKLNRFIPKVKVP